EPESVNQTFGMSTLILDPNQEPQSEVAYSLKEKVAEDLEKLAAMDTTRSKAEEFIELAAKDGWDSAINKFNDLYGKQAKKDLPVPATPQVQANDPNIFRLRNLTSLQRIPNTTLATLAVQSAGNPAVQFIINEQRKQAQFVEQLYSLVPQDSNTLDTVPLIMEFKPDMSFYIIKDISVERLDEVEYEEIKAPRLYREDYTQAQSLAAVHFNPENILKRMNFRLVVRDEEPIDANAPAESEEAS
ncbi:unnamed protein product, partial [marine sediment metagenome]